MKAKSKKVFISVILAILALVLVTAISLVVYFFAVTKDAKLNPDLLPTAKAVPLFFDSNGEKMNGNGEASFISKDEIPQSLENAFIAIEDKRFYKHNGIDFRRLVAAMANNIKAGGFIEGGSTITQQLVKNTHLTQEKSVKRKLNEIVIAKELEKKYTKKEILSMYLTVIYFGKGIYGAKDAAKYYFDKDLKDLTLAESAMLAGIVKNPSKFSPKNNLEKSIGRRNLVLKLMLKQGKISESEYDAAKTENVVLKQQAEQENNEKIYIERCYKELMQKFNCTVYELENMGLKVYTYYDGEVQDNLVKTINDRGLYSRNANGAGIVLDNFCGGIIACYSPDFHRQAGSTLKPLGVYAPALNEGLIYSQSPIKDEKISFGNFSPKNYNNKYYGWTTIKEAVKKSMNSVAVKTLTYLTTQKAINYLNELGLNVGEDDSNLALALGAMSNGTSVKELADGYMALACGGIYRPSSAIKYVILDGNKIEFKPKENVVFSESTAYIMTDMLIDTAQNGTAKTLSVLPYAVASKTGTASRNGINTDAINVAYTLNHTIVCWHYGKNISETGGQGATHSVKKIFENLYKNSTPESFMIPQSVVELNVDGYALKKDKQVKIASSSTPDKYLVKGLFDLNNIPKNVSDSFDRVKLDDFMLETDMLNHACKISFYPESIYGYNIYRIDSEKVLIATVEGKNRKVEIKDIPKSIGMVSYMIEPYIVGTSKKGELIVKKVYFET